MLRRSLGGRGRADGVRPPPASARRPAPRSSTSTTGAGWPSRWRRHDRLEPDPPCRGRATCAAAKLTLSLRITGVRADGFHLIDAEMVTLDLADELTFADGDGLEVVGPVAGRAVPAGDDNLVRAGAARSSGGRRQVRLDKRIPPGAGLGGGSADAAAVLRWAGVRRPRAWPRRLGADVPFCLVGGRARVTRDRRGRRAAAVRRPRPSRCSRRRSGARPRPSTARGTSWAARRPTAATTSSRPRSRSSRGWPVARPASATRRAQRRGWPAAARRGSSRARSPGDGRVGRSPTTDRRPEAPAEPGGYLPAARRWQRVRFSIFLCFFLRMRLRRFLISEPMGGAP